jgi:hypothetical protein
MGSFLQFMLLFMCWLAALATLLVFLETWFALSGMNRFMARRASGAYGVITVFVPMRGPVAKIEETIRSIFGQSYPFIELLLIYPGEDRSFANLAKQFRSARSHIPVRLVSTSFPIDSANDRIRGLEHALPGIRGRWLVVVEPDVVLDRFAIETALEFAGSNEVAAVVLRPGVRCRSTLQRIVAPSMEQLRQTVRIGNRRRERNKAPEGDGSFLLLNREAFDVVNRINRVPGILNDAGWNIWGYQVEGLRTFDGDGARWMWRGADVRSWFSDTEPERRYGLRSAGFVITSAIMALISGFGFAYAFTHGIDDFSGGSIFAFSAVGYGLMSVSYFLFARRLGAAAWFAPLWLLSHLSAALLSLAEMRRLSRLNAESKEPIRKAHTLL